MNSLRNALTAALVKKAEVKVTKKAEDHDPTSWRRILDMGYKRKSYTSPWKAHGGAGSLDWNSIGGAV